MPKYYVSRHLRNEMSLVYVVQADSFGTIRPDGEETEHAGTIPLEVMDQLREVDSGEAGALVEQRRARLAQTRRTRGKRDGAEPTRVFRSGVLTVLGLLVFFVVLGFAVSQSSTCVSEADEIRPRIEDGMTYEEVRALVGGPGRVVPSGTAAGNDLVVRVWDVGSGFLRVTFRDGLVEEFIYASPDGM
jgi:hypothetical protein